MHFQTTLQKMCWKWVCCDRLFLFLCIWISTFQTPSQNLQLLTNVKQYLVFENWFHARTFCFCKYFLVSPWLPKSNGCRYLKLERVRDLLIIILVNHPKMASPEEIRRQKRNFSFTTLFLKISKRRHFSKFYDIMDA